MNKHQSNQNSKDPQVGPVNKQKKDILEISSTGYGYESVLDNSKPNTRE